MVSGNFGGPKPIKTPGFVAEKKFSFMGEDEEVENVKVVNDSDADSDMDDISSMHSDILQFGKKQKNARGFPLIQASTSDIDDSQTSSDADDQ